MTMNPHPLVHFFPDNLPRRRKPPEALRDLRVTLPVSQAERRQLQELARSRGCTIASVLRSAITEIPLPRVEADLIREVNLIGRNLNQLVRAVHSGFGLGPDGMKFLEDLYAVLRDLLIELHSPGNRDGEL